MEITSTDLAGLRRVRLKLHRDERGFFTERFHAKRFAEEGLPTQFAQENHSRSAPGVLRGLHFQHTPAQGKLVGVVAGRICDVVVDIRPWSQTFGKYHAEELSADNGMQLWVPAGFAHGFCVLGEEPADVVYKVDTYYGPGGEGGIRYDDPQLNIPWPLKNPILSPRDSELPDWAQYCANVPQWEKD
ncbi:MAG: dTDP-4-dehydrorhamnose 3,5-epimerase [Proteobacteria bacterium]|nr:dTDP-4-dehydrorhamnose 3,5-epimerase [Pseudomonadota bacterium]